MKKLIIIPAIILSVFIFAASSAKADETYVATLSGVACSGCKKVIAKSLSKIEGVKVIRIEKLEEEGKHKMTVTTDGKVAITKEQAIEAIKHADHYKIESWGLSQEAAS